MDLQIWSDCASFNQRIKLCFRQHIYTVIRGSLNPLRRADSPPWVFREKRGFRWFFSPKKGFRYFLAHIFRPDSVKSRQILSAVLAKEKTLEPLKFQGFLMIRSFDQRLLNWGARLAALRPYFLSLYGEVLSQAVLVTMNPILFENWCGWG